MSDSQHLEDALEDQDANQKVSFETIVRVLAVTKPYWHWLVGFLLAIAIVSVLDSVITYQTKRLVDDVIVPKNFSQLTPIISQYLAFYATLAFFVFVFIRLASVLGERVQHDLRAQMFDHLQRLSFSYFDRTPLGWLMARVTSDAQRVGDLASWGLVDVTWSTVNISTAVVFMFVIEWRLALLVSMVLPILVLIAIQFQKRILGEYRTVRKVNSKITAAYNENITGVRVVKALGREAQNLQEFEQHTREMYQASLRAAILSALFLPMVQLLSALAVAIILWYSGARPTGVAGLSIGGLQAFISYVIFMLWPIQEMARVFAEMQRAVASAERIFTLLDTQPEITDRPNAYPASDLRGTICFENVSFAYRGSAPVLENFNLQIQPGELIAIVGATGAGKSTIINLLCRFYEPTAGRITIGGHDYTEFTQHSIHSHLGVVLQTPYLFAGTINENLRYGRLDATDSDIEAAARLSGAHEFIGKLENGYQTLVGEGGVLLPVGQKQLLSLARAILAQPDIFIMDEATSSVDTLTESLIQKGMAAVLNGRTSIVIAHRLSTIRQADRILVLEKGRVIEMGSHRDLLRQRGQYYRLYTHQFRSTANTESLALTTPVNL